MDSSQEHGSSNGPRTAFQSPTFNEDVKIKVNENVGSASISPSSRDVVLAGYVVFIPGRDEADLTTILGVMDF
jgi:hypothetical protein